MAGGWARDGAVQDQIDDAVTDAVAKARDGLGAGAGRRDCAECGEAIPIARRRAVAGVQRCIDCQQQADARDVDRSAYNRRASKDSQLR